MVATKPLATVTVIVAVPVRPVSSVTVAVKVCEPSVRSVVSQGRYWHGDRPRLNVDDVPVDLCREDVVRADRILRPHIDG